jgi:hypothetical protein
MKSGFFALAATSLVSVASGALIPTDDGTTWTYDFVQERPADNFDLTEPMEQQERDRVTYRLNGTEKVDGKDLRRWEIRRGEALETIDLIAVDDNGLTCPAREDGKGGIIKLNPPQQLVVTPLQAGTHWKFEGTIGDVKVLQRYEMRAAEDVAVPAGKFRAWRIHCEQTAPTPASIDRWFVPGTGFVKVETTLKNEGGTVLQRNRVELLELPRIVGTPSPTLSPPQKKISVGLSSEPTGEFKSSFSVNTPAIYVRWHGQKLEPESQVRSAFIAESVTDVASDFEIDEASTVAPAANSSGTFTLSQPEEGWTPGAYRLEIYLNDNLAETVKFKIMK